MAGRPKAGSPMVIFGISLVSHPGSIPGLGFGVCSSCHLLYPVKKKKKKVTGRTSVIMDRETVFHLIKLVLTA